MQRKGHKGKITEYGQAVAEGNHDDAEVDCRRPANGELNNSQADRRWSMIKSSILKLMMLVFAALGANQTALSQELVTNLTNIGASVNGVTLSIDSSNRVVALDSTIWLSALIKNASTNVITVGESNTETDFAVFSASGSGKIYKQLTPKRSDQYYRFFEMDIAAGAAHDWRIPVIIPKDTAPGDYTLVAIRRFYYRDDSLFELVSNPLKVQIK